MIVGLGLFPLIGFFAFFVTQQWLQDLLNKFSKQDFVAVLLTGLVGGTILLLVWFIALIPIISMLRDFKKIVIDNINTKKYIFVKDTRELIEEKLNAVEGKALNVIASPILSIWK